MAVPKDRKIMVSNEEEFLARKKKALEQLKDLRKNTEKGKISETLTNKLKKELNDELEEINRELVENLIRESREIQNQLEVMRTKESLTKSEQDNVLGQKEELMLVYLYKTNRQKRVR